MAGRRDWDALSERSRTRYNRFFGLNAQFRYESGASLQAARGHRPREHITRYERNPLALTATDYRFLKRQQIRNTKRGAAQLVNFAGPIAAYKRLSPRQRRDLRERVSNDHREYKRQKSITRRTAEEFKATLRGSFNSSPRSGSYSGGGVGGMGSGGGSYYSGGGGMGSGGGDLEDDDLGGEPDDLDYDYEELDFDEYEDIYPDFDDDLMSLSVYH